jgi:hypothetical protein
MKQIINDIVKEAKWVKAIEFASEDAMQSYLHEHPNANPKNHSVKQNFKKKIEEKKNDIQQKKTENFKNWFGDWEHDSKSSSKIVNEKGEPLVVYHGTSAKDFSKFEHTKGESKNEVSGFYFSNNPSFANAYSSEEHGRIYPVYLSIKNPATGKDVQEALRDGVKMKNMSDFLQNKGFDGIYDKPTDIIVAFSPNQIKSAIGNKGTFSPENKNINSSITR